MSQVLSTPRTKRSFAALVIALILAEAVCAFELAMMYVAFPTLISEFQADADTVSWVVTAYLLVSASCAALGGRLGDMFGRRRVLLVALVLSILGTLISLFGGSLLALIIGRGIQGAAGAAPGLVFGLAREHLKKEKLALGLSFIGASDLIAGSAGAFIAGAVIDAFSWHGVFAFAAVLTLTAAISVVVVVPRDTRERIMQSLDVLGAVLLPAAVSTLLFALTISASEGFGSPAFLGLMGTGAVLAIGWILWERRVKNPIVNIRMFKNRHIALTVAVTFAAGVGPIGGAIAVSLIQQYPASPVTEVGLGLTPTMAGLLIAGAAVLGYSASPLGGLVTRKFGSKVTLVVGMGIVTTPLLIIVMTYGNLAAFCLAMLLNAIGTALVFGVLPNVLFEATPQSHSSEVTGANAMLLNIGQSLGVAVSSYILLSYFDQETSLTATEGFTGSLLFCAVPGVLGLILAIFLKKRPAPWVPLVGSAESLEFQDAVRQHRQPESAQDDENQPTYRP